MNISIMGTGYVGLVTGICLAEMGHHVISMDIDESKILTLKQNKLPIYERGLTELLVKNQNDGNLQFTTSINKTLKNSDVCFICVGTPPNKDGSVNLAPIEAAIDAICENLEHACLIVIKSTVPVGTCDKLYTRMNENLRSAGKSFDVDVVSNPEFLKEGVAVDDFMRPNRIVIGFRNNDSLKTMRSLYRDFIRNGHAFLSMSLRSAEMTKYAANAMLATRISFINEIANLCEHLGADVREVRAGIGSDHRIGMSFLYPGIGYGGSCFPKDVQALIELGKTHHYETPLLKATHTVNHSQWIRFASQIKKRIAHINSPVVTVWGLAFKPNTDDIREAPAIKIIDYLLEKNISVQAYDPVAIENSKQYFGNRSGLSFSHTSKDACIKSDALVITTEWGDFRNPDLKNLKEVMRHPTIFDGRNIFEPDEVRSHGFEYFWIGKPHEKEPSLI